MRELSGVGDRSLGQWLEWTGTAFHVRRRLSAEEQSLVGPAVDCRGTGEWSRRFDLARPDSPPQLFGLAARER